LTLEFNSIDFRIKFLGFLCANFPNVEILDGVDSTPMDVGRKTEWLMRKIGILIRWRKNILIGTGTTGWHKLH